MFHIECFVDDKNLGEAFKRLAGIALNLKHRYVPNVEGKQGKPNGHATVSIGESAETFAKEFAKRKLENFTGPQFRDILDKMGFATTSYSYHLQNLVKFGVLKKGKMVGNSLNYIVVKK